MILIYIPDPGLKLLEMQPPRHPRVVAKVTTWQLQTELDDTNSY